jgi:hypothetical protein
MSNVLKFPGSVDEIKEGIENLQKNLNKEFDSKNIKSMLVLVYLKDEPGEVTFYMAGDYEHDREILGDIRLLEQAVLDGDI